MSGATPRNSPVIDAAGNLFGTTYFGGAGVNCQQIPDGCGVLFKIAADGTESTLYDFCSFSACTDGDHPSWLTLEAATKLFAACGKDFNALKAAALSRDFHPVALGAKASFTIDSELRNVESKNVVARLEGSDLAHRDELVVYNAHWDHLGRDTRLQGDQIFNGAADNASGVATPVPINSTSLSPCTPSIMSIALPMAKPRSGLLTTGSPPFASRM